MTRLNTIEMNKFFTSLVLMAGCVLSISAADPYKVSVQFTDDDDNGAMVYIVDYDTKAKIDSIVVAEKVATFKGQLEEPTLAAIVMDGRSIKEFILESGSIIIDPAKRKAFGSMLNDQLSGIETAASNLAQQFRSTKDEAEQETIYRRYEQLTDSAMTANIDNPIGYYLFLDKAPSLSPEEFDIFIASHPNLAKYQRIQKVKETNMHKLSTSVGKKFSDFEVVYEGKTFRLSDYVGKGKYVLVDYWASWCGPCIRQIPVLKELLAEFGDKGLEVLGVAVWDEPANTLKAIESHGINWPCIINAQRIPTDVYGISGIPCIILYGPDGTILSRDKQGDELKADVRAAFSKTLK